MMKFICVYVVILLASISLCHADGFKIKGKISGGGEGVKVFLTDLSQYSIFMIAPRLKMVSLNLTGKWNLLKCVVSRFIKMTVSEENGKVR